MIESKNLKEKVCFYGRNTYDENGAILYNSLSGFSFVTSSLRIVLKLKPLKVRDNRFPILSVIIDDDYNDITTIEVEEERNYEINFKNCVKRKIKILKRTEAIDSYVRIIEIDSDKDIYKVVENKKYNLEVIGDSTMSGFGNCAIEPLKEMQGPKNTDALKTVGFVASRILDCNINSFNASGWGARASIFTTPEKLSLMDRFKYVCPTEDILWNHKKYIPDVLLISLGANDYFYIRERKKFEKDALELFKQRYIDFIDEVHRYYGNIKIVMIYGQMRIVESYENYINLYNEIIKRHKDVYLIKLEGDTLGIDCHPSSEVNEKNGLLLVELLKEIMK